LRNALNAFVAEKRFHTKGSLSVALVVTEHARKRGLPLSSEQLKTAKGGQVLGLGQSAVQAILKRHNIERLLAKEAGRTSRGSIKNMEDYVTLLNGLYQRHLCDIDAIEDFWICEVRKYFMSKPLKVKLDVSKNLRVCPGTSP
jgi:Domain of unknown function (DUF4928)